MAVGEAMIAAGIGCRSGVSADEVVAAVRAALAQFRAAPADLAMLATGETKRREAGICAAAGELGIPLTVVGEGALRSAASATLSHSPRSLAATGLGSLAEAAALAAAGPEAVLLGPRLALGNVTCALAEAGGRR
jgi:cobalt-precorrin 5A hydrolase